jgi:hypothetical protein
MSVSDKDDDKEFVMQDDDSAESEVDDYENFAYEAADEISHRFFSMPLIVSAVGFLFLIILFIVIIFRGQDLAEKEHIAALGERIDRLETVLTSQLDQVTKELNRLDRTLASIQTPPAKVSPPPGKVPEKELPDLEPKIHKVQPGDTLYEISRQYGLTIDELCSYNKLEPYSKIYPGQKLKLTP